MKTRDEADNEEAYWFVRWCQIRSKLKRTKKALQEVEQSDISVLRQENIKLKQDNVRLESLIIKIRKDFVPEAPKRKRAYKGNNPNKKQ